MKNEKKLLQERIALLEKKQAEQMAALKQQFDITYESVKPINILKNTLQDVASSPDLKNLVLNNVIGFGTGYLSKKIVSGVSHHPLVNIAGTLVQMAVSNIVTKNPEGIKAAGKNILQFLFSKKQKEKEKENEETETTEN